MAATVGLSEDNGVSVNVGPNYGGTTTNNITSINFGSIDSPNIVVISHPIIIGGNSYMKWLRAYVSNMGGSTNISTFKFWRSDANGYKAGEAVGGNFYPGIFSYAQAIVTQYAHRTGSGGGGYIQLPYNGDGFTPGGTGPLGAQYSAFPVPLAAPAAENISIGGAIGGSIAAAPSYSDYLLLGLMTTGATPNGAVFTKTFTLQWNEV